MLLLKMICADHRWHMGLASEAIKGATLPFEGINNIHSSDGLPLGVLGVGDGVPDDILKEHFQDSPSLLVDETRDPLHSTPPSQSPNSRLGDPLDVVSQHFTMPLSSSLTQSLS